MSTITKKMDTQSIMELKNEVQPYILKESQPQYTHYQIKLDSCSITAYTSGKVVFQGKDLSWMEEEKEAVQVCYPHAGSDEVGTGDYFGPVVVAACIVEEKDVEFLTNLGIQDSKKMKDDYIRQVAGKIEAVCPHSIMIVSNEKYNHIQQTNNINAIKAKLHNFAYINLKKKGYTLPSLMVIDQFVNEKKYFEYLKNENEVIRNLRFETKAESQYLAVACASVLARDTFLRYWDKMEEKYDFIFPKGAGSNVDAQAKKFIDCFGMEELKKVAKIHFKNTEKALNQ